MAREGQEERPHENLESHEGGRGVARQSKDRLIRNDFSWEMPKAHWASRADLHPPEVELESGLVEYPLEEVGLTHGSAPECDQHVRAAGPLDMLAEVLRIVTGDPETQRDSSARMHGGSDQMAVAFGNAILVQERRVELRQLIAAGNDRHRRFSPHRYGGRSGGRQRADLSWTDAGTGLQHRGARRPVLACGSNITPTISVGEDSQATGIGLLTVCILDPNDRIGAVRHGATGHDSHRLPRTNDAVEARACMDDSRHGQLDVPILCGPFHIGALYGIAVHCAVVPGRKGCGCEDVRGQCPSKTVGERYVFHGERRSRS